MKLIGSLTSPYVRKVRIVLAEKRIGYDFEVDSPWDAENHVSHHNPLGKIPVLILDDGSSLFDSRVIVEYLDSVNPVSRLIPEPNRHRITVKRWEALADGICDAAAAVFLERRRVAAEQSPDWISRQLTKVTQGLAGAARELGDRKWCDGNAYTLADVALGCTLGYLAFRFPEIEWRTTSPNLAELSDKLEKRAPFMETAPK
ncbi:glutathione S-transferase [Nitrosovibrio sp. Nv17]|jgi:glutathione S-transferase|uniref:glutathione S-transferase n=1 Tax=Nitrosovibrio sp. Nv17 TaxID=1855339 RepID=UPI000908A47B|nr:glutathione S-transferase [Nitrosovibrio sp. Nv17]SFW12007.1 glutathione S-transferase [Nitrosovibrio sp. Nv17]